MGALPRREERPIFAFMRSAPLCLATCLAICLSSPARAVPCAPPVGGAPSLVTIDSEVRLAFIQHHLRDEARRARAWSWTWGSVYSTVTVAELALVPLRAPEDRIDAY